MRVAYIFIYFYYVTFIYLLLLEAYASKGFEMLQNMLQKNNLVTFLCNTLIINAKNVTRFVTYANAGFVM
jgi:hypothetical protein